VVADKVVSLPRKIISLDTAFALAFAGLVIGAVFGAVVFHTNYCAMGAISDAVTFGDKRRLRSWLLAIAVAVLSAQALQAAGIVELGKSIYLPATLDWLGALLGGLLFGYGMVFAGGCASKNLVRVGGGDLRALMTLLVLGMSAYAAIGGLFGPVRAELARFTAVNLAPYGFATQGLGTMLARYSGIGTDMTGLAVGGLLAFCLLLFCLADKGFRSSKLHVMAGLGVGLSVAAGWAVTGFFYDELSARPVNPASLTFVRPTGDSMEWLMRFTAAPIPGFGVACVVGTILGAFFVARATRRFRVATFADVADTRRHLFGAVLMGVGGIMASGCTMGQAITGLSTLATGSLLAFAGILAGGVLGVKALERSLTADGDWSI
jgi:uncharacterized protein